ncbi:MAG: TlpA disulfide reductase family protein [Nevskia sp.]|nr:TlpA disulfide reductase family protein [Nevskia sp.]
MNHRLPQRWTAPPWIGSALSIILALGAASAHAANVSLAGPLQAYAGKVVYVDFWASWCGPCAESFPWLNAMQTRYGNRMAIVAVNVDADTTAAKAFLTRHPADFAVVYDPAGSIAEQYHIDGMPSTVILSADGRVIHQHSGFFGSKATDYEAVIRNIVDSPTPPTARALIP